MKRRSFYARVRCHLRVCTKRLFTQPHFGCRLGAKCASITALPELYPEFDAGQWAGLVESMTVYDKDRIVWKRTCGMEMIT